MPLWANGSTRPSDDDSPHPMSWEQYYRARAGYDELRRRKAAQWNWLWISLLVLTAALVVFSAWSLS